MNEKAKAELVRQLVEGSHCFAYCTNCREQWLAETPIETCPNGCGPQFLQPDPDEAAHHYRKLIDQALKWGES